LIRAIQVGEVWLESPHLIRQATVEFFKNHFQSVRWQRPMLGGVEFPRLAEGERERI
jgi:hypothetical protein